MTGRAFEELIGRMRDAGVRLDAEGIADALWLAQWAGPEGRETRAPMGRSRSDRWDQDVSPAPAGGAGDPYPPGADADPAEPFAAGRHEVDLHPRRGGAQSSSPPVGDAVRTVSLPAASAFPGLLPLERSLRPIQSYRPQVAAVRTELDEPATADLTAEAGGLVLPVLRGVRRQEAELHLLMDASASMAVWEQMLQELREVCERVGAFRNVTIHYLRPRGNGVAISSGPGAHEALRPVEQLFDPTGRNLGLVVSDCAGPLWQSGALHRMLHRWVRTAPVAVVQPLPQRLWGRTLLPAVPGLLRRPQGGGHRAPRFHPLRRVRGPVPSDALPVPVLSPVPAALDVWGRLSAGTAGVTLNGAAAWVSAEQSAVAPRAPGSEDLGPEELVRVFDESASAPARQLALYLSATPLTLPVMQLVQRSMLPQTGPPELAEILLSGLVRVAKDSEDEPGAEGLWYDFLPGVRDQLLGRLSAGEAALVLKHCSLYIERTFGRSARNFPAVAVAYLSGAGREPATGPDAVPEPFARVSERVLRRFEPTFVLPAPSGASPEPAAAVEPDPAAEGLASLERYEREGASRDLLEAVRLLRAARVPADVRLADALLYAWREWRDPGALDEAEQAAQNALTAATTGADVPGGTGPAATVTLVSVLKERAADRIANGQLHAALADLLRATDQCRTALRNPGAEPEPLLRCALLHAQALRTLYVIDERLDDPLGQDERALLLTEAEDCLTALLPRWPPSGLPAALLLERGRVLLARARAAGPRGDGTEQQALVLRAVADLEAGARPADPTDIPRADLPAALLDLAEALALETGGRGWDRAAEALEEARDLAHDLGDGPLEAECLRRTAGICRARYTQSAEPGPLRRADDALARAVPLVPVDSPVHAALLAERGEVLLERAAGTGETALVTEAVHVLREAVSETPPHTAGAAARRLHFGRALRLRHQRQGGLADLHEAAWTLEQAGRAEDPSVSSRAALELGDVRVALGNRTGVRENLEQAAVAYRRAAADAVAAGNPLLAAQAQHRRGEVLETTAGVAAALEAYRESWEQWQAAGGPASPEALRTRSRMRVLETPP
ncbi:SAV_2336 N-terminal domain-related protein [Actinacidiphila glaucinigra]|uniref:SAV_2336 N-terminal domain-related protein n=1 Tax=Actinacidiphila glaucinigra TaxID=235986 RepID=UPI003672F6C5